MSLPWLSVIVVARSETPVLLGTLEKVRSCGYPEERLEILVALGQQPSRQRNLAARSARGEILYFLDEDSQVAPGQLHRVASAFAEKAILGVCGPNLASPSAGALGEAVDRVWTSFWGIGPKYARYRAVGRARPARDQDWIGCNLALRAQTFEAVGGFDEELWPDEEHDLLERLQGAFGRRRFWHLPEAWVRRPRPEQLADYARTLLAYGEARMSRLRARPGYWLSPGVLPLAGGGIGILGLLAGVLAALEPTPGLGPLQTLGSLTSLAYALWLTVGILAACRRAPLRVGLWCALLFPLTHLLYGWGQWRGLRRRQRSSPFQTQGRPVQVLDRSSS